MKTEKILISENDYSVLCEMLRLRKNELGESAGKLAAELKRAHVVNPSKLDHDVVRMNSKVTIRDGSSNQSYDLTLVFPGESDISQHKISVFAPLGTALLGFRKGDYIEWEVPAGKRSFIIEEVIND